MIPKFGKKYSFLLISDEVGEIFWRKQGLILMFSIPISGGNCQFKTKSGMIIANGYDRIVIGKRGPYIEFSDKNMVFENICVPPDQRYRLGNDKYFYDEWRSKDSEAIKIYNQKNTVVYADYKIGKWYISPELLTVEGVAVCLNKLEEQLPLDMGQPAVEPQISLFDHFN